MRSRKCVCLLLVAVLVAMIVFVLLVTNIIPIRSSDSCEVTNIKKIHNREEVIVSFETIESCVAV